MYSAKSFLRGESIDPQDRSKITSSIEIVARNAQLNVSEEQIVSALDLAFSLIECRLSYDFFPNNCHIGISVTKPEPPLCRKPSISYLIVFHS